MDASSSGNSGKVLSGGLHDRTFAQTQTHQFSLDSTTDNNTNSAPTILASKQLVVINQNKIEPAQAITVSNCKSNSNSPTTSSVNVISNIPSQNGTNQKQVSLPSTSSSSENVNVQESSNSNKKGNNDNSAGVPGRGGILINRSTSSYRSTTSSPIFSVGVKQEPSILERSDSILSKGSSHQGKYHNYCIPQIDPTLIIGGARRSPSPRPRSKRPRSFKRPGSDVTLLSRRESVTNLVFSGPSAVDHNVEENSSFCGWETANKKRLSFGNFSCASSLFSRMGSPSRDLDVTPGEFDVMEDDDYSTTRISKFPSSSSSSSSSKQQRLHQSRRPGFLYQVVTFDCLAKDVPPFVKNYTQKYGKMVTESFILRVNYLRRRRQLGETTGTINIGNNNNSSHNAKRPHTGNGSPR